MGRSVAGLVACSHPLAQHAARVALSSAAALCLEAAPNSDDPAGTAWRLPCSCCINATLHCVAVIYGPELLHISTSFETSTSVYPFRRAA